MIQGKRQYLWRAVDQDGNVLDILVQSRKDKSAAKRFFRKLLKGQERTPIEMITDKLRSYAAAKKEMMPCVVHCQDKSANNRAEVSHEHTREQERQMRRFTSPGQAQRFLSVHGQVHNLFRLGRVKLTKPMQLLFTRWVTRESTNSLCCARHQRLFVMHPGRSDQGYRGRQYLVSTSRSLPISTL